jgi:putative membrane protein
MACEMFVSRVSKGILAGAAAGLVGAWVMSKFQERAESEKPHHQKSGDETAPAKAANSVAVAVLDRPLANSEKAPAAVAAHYATGALSGAVYGAAAEILPVSCAGVGVPFGAVLWLIADEVAVPSLGLSKAPTQFPLSTHADALAAHMVFGVTTEVTRRVVKALL